MLNPTETHADERYAVRCLNGLKHGSTARKLFIREDNPEHFFALLKETFEAYKPNTKRDAQFVADLVYARWFLLRRERASAFFEFNLRLQKPDPEQWTAEDRHSMRLLKRYQIEAERAVESALENLHHFDEDGRRIRSWQSLHDEFKERLAQESPSRLAA